MRRVELTRRRGRGRIPDRDIAAIRERVRIEDIVGDYVQLRRAGAGSLKGLCPFHDEKSPSLPRAPQPRPLPLLRMRRGRRRLRVRQKIEHVASSRPSSGSPTGSATPSPTTGRRRPVQRDRGSRSRLLAANAAAAGVLRRGSCSPRRPRRHGEFLAERGFDADAAAHFGCGFAPSGWDSLTKHLLRKGFEHEELEAAGLVPEGRRGPIDRFRRRLLWPIRAVGGEVIGFGARRLFDDDDTGQVPQHPRDAVVQEVAGAVRAGPRQARDRQVGTARSSSRATPT